MKDQRVMTGELLIPGDVVWSEDEVRALESAVEVLENPGFLLRMADSLGTPVEWALDLLERRVPGGGKLLRNSVEKALWSAAKIAVGSLSGSGGSASRSSRGKWHRRATGLTGALGGAFGLPGLAVELPVTTTLMLRAIADVASQEGEDLESMTTRLECLKVFGLSGRGSADDAAESGYFAARVALARAVRGAAAGATAETLGRLIVRIAPRFEIAVGEKLAAQALPLFGAVGGAALNVAFTSHFQAIARAHFTVRRIERFHGEEAVREAYDRILEQAAWDSDEKR